MTSVLRRMGHMFPTLVLVVFVIAIFGSFALFYGVTTEGDVELLEDDAVSLHQYRALTVGSSREEVEERVGPGRHALEHGFADTGIALEPIDADCVYYPQAGTGNLRDIVQLCFRGDRLSHKRTYEATPGPPLVGTRSAP